MKKEIVIGDKKIGSQYPTFVVAEMSGNHNQSLVRAKDLIRAAKEAGADAVKIQTYTADTITLNSDKPFFYTEEGGLWEGQTLYELYQKAYTPWEWQPELKKYADELGILLFSSPFDETAVDFLEKMDVPAYKIASFEINDVGLLRKVARTGKPILISTGIADMSDIALALQVCKEEGNESVVLLKCTSAYPSPYDQMNLKMIPNMKETFGSLVGLSDHSMGDEVAIAAVALGANVVEKHFTMFRSDGGVDSDFSMEASEMKEMIEHIRNVEKALGIVDYSLSDGQKRERRFSRSLFVVADMKKGDVISRDNVRSVRPGMGLHTKYLEEIIGKKVTRDLEYATPLRYGDIEW